MSHERFPSAQTILQRNPLRYVTSLKLLHTYGAAIHATVLEQSGASGVMLQYPPQVFPYDGQTYPDAVAIVLIATDDAMIAEALLDQVPTDQPVVFKLVDPLVCELMQRRFAVRRVVGFVSYTSPADWPQPAVAHVRISGQPERRVLDLFIAQQHDRRELEQHFRHGHARAFVAYNGDQPAAACYVFQNFGPIWEVAGVVTEPSLRRRGYGRQVVQAAIHYLREQGLRPRYQVHEANQPSIALAESIGLKRFVTIEHFVTTP